MDALGNAGLAFRPNTQYMASIQSSAVMLRPYPQGADGEPVGSGASSFFLDTDNIISVSSEDRNGVYRDGLPAHEVKREFVLCRRYGNTPTPPTICAGQNTAAPSNAFRMRVKDTIVDYEQ